LHASPAILNLDNWAMQRSTAWRSPCLCAVGAARGALPLAAVRRPGRRGLCASARGQAAPSVSCYGPRIRAGSAKLRGGMRDDPTRNCCRC